MDRYKILAFNHEEIKKVQQLIINDLIDVVINRRNDMRYFAAEQSCIELIKRQLKLDCENEPFIFSNRKMIIANITDSNHLDDYLIDKRSDIENAINKTADKEWINFYQWLLVLQKDVTFIELYINICKKFGMIYINKTLDRIV